MEDDSISIDANSKNNSIVIMGCKHCGKSTHGKKLAQELGVDFFDTDSVLEEITGMPFRDYYLKNGVAAFMEAEEKACKKIVEENAGKKIVVATGGGICDNAPALTALRELGKFVFLELDIEYSIKRVASKIKPKENGDGFDNMPAYIAMENPKTMDDILAILRRRYEDRFTRYRNICDITVELKNASIDENFAIISGAL